jgi:ubiquinone/menaquinone biosynthesis C-methylase UbiE
MTQQDYEYRGMMATTWDLLRGDTSNWSDRFFYREVIQTCGEPVLDVGCGTGRLLLDFLVQGVEIEGVDNSPEMLALCREKATGMGLSPVLYEQTMEELDLPRLYQTIIVPSSSFQLVLAEGAPMEAMRRLYAHLLPDGTLAMPFMTFWREGDPLETDWHIRQEATREDGTVVRKWSYSLFDPATQMEHTQERYELLRDGEVVSTEHHERSPATRSYTQSEAVELFETAGFIDLRLFHEFTQEPVREEDRIFCVVGRTP